MKKIEKLKKVISLVGTKLNDCGCNDEQGSIVNISTENGFFSVSLTGITTFSAVTNKTTQSNGKKDTMDMSTKMRGKSCDGKPCDWYHT